MYRSHEYQSVLDETSAFCDEFFTEERISQWVDSCGVPRAVRDAFYSRFGKYCLPVEAGGSECTMQERALVVACLSHRAGATLPFLSDMISGALLKTMCSQSQFEIAQDFLSRYGHISFSQAFSEDGAGTSASSVQTVVTMEGDKLYLDGKKTFVSNGQFASDTLVLAQDPIFGGEDGGMSLWLVPTNQPGISTYPLKTLGQEMLAPAILEFDGVELDPEWRIQSGGRLSSMLRRQYELGRVLVCASSWGLARAALDDALQHACNHMIKGRSLGSLPQIQEKLTDMEIKLRSMGSLIMDAAKDVSADNGGSHLSVALMKRYVPAAATEVASEALQIFGGAGYTETTRVGRIWRDCRGNQVAQGTDEVMAGIAAKMLLAEFASRH